MSAVGRRAERSVDLVFGASFNSFHLIQAAAADNSDRWSFCVFHSTKIVSSAVPLALDARNFHWPGVTGQKYRP